MKIFRTLAAVVALGASLAAFADGPFRQHRYDSFQATPTEPGQIMFAGNSITNMHSWFEAFGAHQEVVGRGNSGGFATELLENLESYIDSKPSKLFVMIGTNDISSGTAYAKTARDIQIIAQRVRLESPETEIYLQTILPRSANAKPDYELCNSLVAKFVEAANDPKIHLVNLSEVCAPLNGNGTWSYDGLHPRPIGYSAWCHHIQDFVGYNTVYPAEITSQDPVGAGNNSNGARVEQFPYYPVSAGDVLFFGDETIHGGEWHELLRSGKVKDRGLMWGWGGVSLPVARNIVRSALQNQAEKPAKIFLFYGVGGQDENNYRLIVDEAKAQAPQAEIYVVSLTPSTNADQDAVRTSFNEKLQTIASEKGATYVDIYTPLKENIGQNIMSTNYVSGRGYIVMANELAKHIEGTNPVSMSEYEKVYNHRAARRTIGNALTEALRVDYGTDPGQIKESHRGEINEAINAAVAAVVDPQLTAAAATAAANALNSVISNARADLNMPMASTADAPIWYRIASIRNNKPLTATETGLNGGDALGASTNGSNIWRFESRGDETYNIVNAQGVYITPSVAYDTQMKVQTSAPEIGFSLGISNKAGAFVIYSSDSQLNQTSKANFPVYNWYSKSGAYPDGNDDGCAWVISLYDGTLIDESKTPDVTGWYEITRVDNGMSVTNLDEMTIQNGKNAYAMRYVSNPKPSPKNWIHITAENGAHYLRSMNGFEVGEYVYAVREQYNLPIVASPTTADAYNIKYFWAFPNAGITDVIGRSAGKNDPHYISRVSDKTLDAYDVWTVKVVANTASLVSNDTKVSLNIPANRGLTTVYNKGAFFVDKGTIFGESDIDVTPAEGVEQMFDSPVIKIDKAKKIITVDYTHNETADELTDGWYEIQRVDNGMSVTNLDEMTLLTSNGKNYCYAMRYVKDPVPGPKNWIHVSVDNDTYNLRTLNGFDVSEFVSASRVPYNFPIAQSTTVSGAYDIKYFFSFTLNDITDVVGRASSKNDPHNITRVSDETLAAYDLWTVRVVANTADVEMNDTKVSVNLPANKGLVTVYNNGAYFLERGTQLTATDVVVTPALDVEQDYDTPLVVVDAAAKTITVDFTQTGVKEVASKSDAPVRAYDLWGRRVATPRHGLYIVNGRKVRI